MLRSRRAQSTLEYITVFAVAVAAIVGLAYTVLRPAISKMLDSSANRITNAATDFDNSNTGNRTTP